MSMYEASMRSRTTNSGLERILSDESIVCCTIVVHTVEKHLVSQQS
jgi:hypothetical protein